MFVMKIDYSREGMGGRKPTAVHLCKTGWKPAMEHYFVDLMLDQVHRGNRIGHTFNKQAWNEMLVLFNASFVTPYDVHTLKSHYTHLWKQFNDIKSLLDQDGFSWDNTQKMVIADKKAWAAYVKVHPDAKFYRNKALTTFNDLCLIYAHTNANGRYSLSSHDTEFYDDLKALIEGVTTPAPASKVQTDTDWKPAMDPFFLRLMLDQLEKGRKINNTFKKQAWKDMVTLFNTKFGSQYRKNFLKQLYKKLLKYYTDVKGILATRGFHWDDRRRMIQADDNVWDNYIKALPGARLYRNKPLLRYQDLNLIYGDEISNGLSNGLCNPLHQGEESEDCSFPGNGHLASFEDLDSEGQGLMIDEEGEDIQSHGNVDLSRIDWTPSMECCLMDIMLEQLQKANKIDYPFDDQAWIDVFVLFKERIGLQCDKDSFRSRYRSLEKQYHDTKDLLQHKGFWWDETEQMVSAHDNVWGAYIKEHPDVESYRTKSKPNYNDLCLIHGNSDSCDRCNQSGQAMGCNGHAKSNHNYHWRTNWTPQMDRYFIDLMLEQVRYESMLNNIFSKLAWTEMVSKFRTEFGPQHDEDDLKSRFLNLRKLFNDMKTLLDQNGFSWDEMQQMITAHGDLRDAYVKEHSDADSYRNRTLPNFNDLYLIYGNGDVPKRESSSSHFMDAKGDDSGIDVGNELKQHLRKEHQCSIAFENRISDNWNDMKHGNGVHDGRSGSLGTEGKKLGTNLIVGELQSADMKFEVSDHKRKRKPAASSTSASKRPQITIKEEIQETFDEKPHIIVRGLADNGEGRDCCSIETIVAALETIPDMDDRLFLRASRVLEDERKAKMFVAMDVAARQKWLYRKLRQ